MFIFNDHLPPWTKITLVGRVVSVSPITSGVLNRLGSKEGLVVDVEAGRLHGASIAGLVVGAMGVFVFTVALRHWLKERRAFGEAA